MSSSVASVAQKVVKLVAAFFITLFILVWLFSSLVSHHYASKYFSDNQLILGEQTTIRYNPFWSRLTISDLVITTKNEPNEPVIALRSLSVTLSLYRLITDTLHFSEFTIDGLLLNVDLDGESPVVGGFVIQNNSEETLTPTNEEIEIQESTENNYQLSLPELNLTDSTFDVTIKESQQEFVINSLIVKNILASTTSQQAEVVLNAFINQAPLALTLNAKLKNNQGSIESTLKLTELALAPFQPFLSAGNNDKNELIIQGLIDLESKQSILISDKVTSFDLQTLELKSKDLMVTQKNKTIALNIDLFAIQDLLAELAVDQAPKVTGIAKLNLSDIMAYKGDNSHLLAKIAALNINEIALTTVGAEIKANLPNIIIEDALFAENTNDDIPPLTKFQNLTITNIEVSQQGLSIDTINLLGLGIDTNLDKDKNIIGLLIDANDEQPDNESVSDVLEKNKQANTPEQTAPIEKSKPVFALSLNKFSLDETSHINFTDRSITPNYKRYFDITKFNAGPFDNQQPKQDSHFRLEGSSNKYAYFELSVIAKPFSDKDFYQLNGLFKEVSLPSLSTYISEALQYELKSGQLDVELDITIDNSDIDGNAFLQLRGVELGAANDHETGTVKSQTSVPFNVALGMLKDGNGNVELDIPLEGSTNDPSFGMRGFISLMIKQATMTAAREYLLTTFVPYANVVNVAISAGEYLLKVRFNDLVFPIKETKLTTEQSEFLIQFSALMKDKPETQLTLCAISTPEDIDKPLGTEIINKDDIKQLAELSKQRLHAFKNYMVKQEKIASSRLLLCSPKIDSSVGAKSRITFTD